jgi:hypothetical protein
MALAGWQARRSHTRCGPATLNIICANFDGYVFELLLRRGQDFRPVFLRSTDENASTHLLPWSSIHKPDYEGLLNTQTVHEIRRLAPRKIIWRFASLQFCRTSKILIFSINEISLSG